MESKPAEDGGPLAAAASSFPLLVYDHGAPPDILQTVLSVADGSLRTVQVPEMCNYTCLETPQGLVLMVDTAAAASSQQCWLWNPQTGEKTALPAMDEPLPDHCRCLVSAAATGPSPSPGSSWVPDGVVPCPDSFVLVYDLARPTLRFCRIRGGDGARWVSQTYDLGLHEVPGKEPTQRAIGDMAAVQGAFFYLESRDALGGLVVSLADGPEPRLEPVTFHASLPKLARDAEQTVTQAYLLESDKRFFLVCLFFIGCTLERIEDVGAYVFDFTEEEWCRVSDIGDAAFLLGPGGFAASCPAARHGLKRGCVYFAWDFLGDGNDVDFHIFDLKEGTREVARPNQDIPALNIEPFWFVPVLP